MDLSKAKFEVRKNTPKQNNILRQMKKGKSTTGYPPRDPKGAKKMKDPQLDMKTWKAPKKAKRY